PQVVEANRMAKMETLLADPLWEIHNNQIMTDAPALKQEQIGKVPLAPTGQQQVGTNSLVTALPAPPVPTTKSQPVVVSKGVVGLTSALEVTGPVKYHQGYKPPIDVLKLEVVFSENIPA
ncbi:hypothetical protein C0989_009241, partial [Termitomyces sp. Mn162]